MDIRRTTEYCEELDNLNIVIKPNNDLNGLGLRDLLVKIVTDLDGIDCYLVGDEFSLGNLDCGYRIYCANTDMIYTLSLSRLLDIQRDSVCILYAEDLDDDDRELVNSYFGD